MNENPRTLTNSPQTRSSSPATAVSPVSANCHILVAQRQQFHNPDFHWAAGLIPGALTTRDAATGKICKTVFERTRNA